ncbi:MAG TPA: GLUG motif-containing protein, partial [Asticcacaulis sp.]
GLIGYNQSAGVQNAYATGSVVSSGDSVGGLIGYNNNATLTDAYATGSIRGNHNVGGLIGFSLGSAYYNVYAMGSVTGGAYVGGLLGTSFGGVYFEDAFATGFVRGQYTGGLVGVSESYTPTLIRSYYIPDTTGQCCTADGFGGGLAVTTAQLQGVLPSGFSSTDWGTGPGLYPYLKVFFPNGAQAISGMAYADTSGDAAVGSVAVYSGGKQLGTSGVGANGYYYVVTDAGAIGATTGVGADLTLYGDANPSGVGYADTHALTDGNVTDLDVTTGRIDVTTGAATDSSVQGGIASAFGSAIWSGVLANIGNPDYGLTATGAFTVDDDPPGFGNLTIRSGGDLTVAHAITLNGNGSLTLDAHDNLNIDATVTAPGNNAVTLTYADGGAGDYGFGLQSDGFQGSLDYTGSGGGLTINGAAYTLLYSLSDLAGISGGSGAYALARTLDASGATYSASVVGQLSGALTGLGHTVANLTISGAGVDNTGLIGQLKSGGVVRDIGLAGGAITGGTYVGGLVGVNDQGAVTDAYVTASVTGDALVGGLVGFNQSGIISNVIGAGSVSANGSGAGGVAGQNSDQISRARATGAVTSIGGVAGGLAGVNNGAISVSFATGAVTSLGGGAAGGLVGYDYGTISDAFATGAVTSLGGVAGGLAGGVTYGAISNAYATGYVRGATTAGVVGSSNGSTLSNLYYDSGTTGQSDVAATGMATAQMQSGGLPSGFDPAVWATGAGLYPYLKSAFPNGVQAISGMATDLAGAPVAGAGVTLYAGGAVLATAGSGANGYYYVARSPGAVTASTLLGATLTLDGAAHASGLTFSDGRTLCGCNVVGVDIASQVADITSGAATYSGLQSQLGATFGGAWSDLSANLGTSVYMLSLDNAFTFDQAISLDGTLLVTDNGGVTLDHDI